MGSCRHKLKEADFPAILEMLRKLDIRYYLPHRRQRHDGHHPSRRGLLPRQGYELIGVGVPKTVDNDLCGTDHTPGFGSAARYVALSVKQAGMLARDMKLRRPIRDFPDRGPLGRLAAGGRRLGQGRPRTTPRTSSSCRNGPSTRTASWPT